MAPRTRSTPPRKRDEERSPSPSPKRKGSRAEQLGEATFAAVFWLFALLASVLGLSGAAAAGLPAPSGTRRGYAARCARRSAACKRQARNAALAALFCGLVVYLSDAAGAISSTSSAASAPHPSGVLPAAGDGPIRPCRDFCCFIV